MVAQCAYFTAKHFAKAISSFALVPSAQDTPLASNVMVVTKEGDLELYALHDTPTHTPWSARGDLALGIGKSYTIISGLHEPSPPPEPWELTTQSLPVATPRSVPKQLLLHEEAASLRGRGGAPMFGRGDEDGFPALPAAPAPRRAGGGRMLSPSGWRNKYFEHSAPVKRTVSGSSPTPVRGGAAGAEGGGAGGNSSKAAKRRSLSRKNRDASPLVPWGVHNSESVQNGVESDISMVMRKRLVNGYGLANVSALRVLCKCVFTDDMGAKADA